MSQIQVRNKHGEGIPLLNIRISNGTEPQEAAIFDVFTDYSGNSGWPIPHWPEGGYTLYFNVANIQKEYGSVSALVNHTNNVEVVLPFAPPPPLQRVHTEADKFALEDGSEFKWIFASNFMLHQRHAEGEDIRPVLYKGFNGYRIFGSYHWIAQQMGKQDFDPTHYPNWQSSLDSLADLLLEENKYFQYNILCDRQFLPGDLDKMRWIVDAAVEVLRPKKNAILALGNENFKNGFNANDFDKPSGVVICTGSGPSGGPAPLSDGRPWDYQCQHLRRDEKMFIDVPPMEAPTYKLNRLLLFDETIGFADFDKPGSRSNNPTWAYQLGTVMRGWYGGVCHLHSGVHSLPLGSRETECKDAFIRGTE